MSLQRQFGALLVGASLTLMALTSAPTAWADDPADPLNALMMGGSFMPTPSEFWQDTIITDYVDPATGDICTPVLVPTPESAASSSIPVGLADLQAAMDEQPAGQPYLIEGYSQSAQIAIDEKLDLIGSGRARTSKTCWNSPASSRICSIRSSDSSDRWAECSPAKPIRPIGRAGIMPGL